MLRKIWLCSVIVLLLAAPALANKEVATSTKTATNGVLKVVADPVRVETGLVRGLVTGEAEEIQLYRGIPFAAPPVGELRWQAPQPPKAWEGVRDCFAFGAAAPQKTVPFLSAFAGMGLGRRR